MTSETQDPSDYAPEALEDLKERIIGRLRTVYDPEIPVNIYDLGLIYKIEAFPAAVTAKVDLFIEMTLTAPGCPMADAIVEMTQSILVDLPEVADVQVNLVWDPPWDKSRMSEEARFQLDMY